MHDAQAATNHGQKTCEACGQPFKPKKSWQRFCRQKCRDTWHKTGSGGGDLSAKVDQLEQRVRDLEAMVWPTGK